MLKITSDFFTNMSNINSNTPLSYHNNPFTPLTSRPTATDRYGHHDRNEDYRYECLELSFSQLTHIKELHSTTYDKRRDPNCLNSSNITFTEDLGFGPLGTNGKPFLMFTQTIPYYIILHYLKHNINNITPLYYKLILEYNVRHDLYESYNRPLDVFSLDTNSTSYYLHNPLHFESYDKLRTLSERDRQLYSNVNFTVCSKRIKEFTLTELKRLLLFLNRYYITLDTSQVYTYPVESATNPNTAIHNHYAGGNVVIWLTMIFKELKKREEEYKQLSHSPDNVLFTI